MNKREAGRLRKQRLAQIDRAFAARLKPSMSDPELRALYRERDRQIRLTQEEYERNVAYKPRKSAREISTSRFWRHFGQDGRPIPPWETEAGPHVDDDDDYGDDDDDDGGMFAPGDYSYEDFDADWGGYDYVDTGYPDEHA